LGWSGNHPVRPTETFGGGLPCLIISARASSLPMRKDNNRSRDCPCGLRDRYLPTSTACLIGRLPSIWYLSRRRAPGCLTCRLRTILSLEAKWRRNRRGCAGSPHQPGETILLIPVAQKLAPPPLYRSRLRFLLFDLLMIDSQPRKIWLCTVVTFE